MHEKTYQLETIIGAVQKVAKKSGDMVIKEGDEGDVLYIIDSGTLSCTKIFKGNTDPTWLKKYEPGEAFGELALLYNAPRAATITSDGDSCLFALDR